MQKYFWEHQDTLTLDYLSDSNYRGAIKFAPFLKKNT
jgi:hypothetical protein